MERMSTKTLSATTALVVLYLSTITTKVEAVKNILDFGAVIGASGFDLAAAQANGKALYDAVEAAMHDDSGAPRVALVPDYWNEAENRRGNFTFMPYRQFDGLFNVTIQLDGVLNFYEGDINNWPNISRGGDSSYPAKSHGLLNGIGIYKSSYITLTSGTKNGTLVGNGLRWWWTNIFDDHRRPQMVDMHSCLYTTIEYWTLFDGPNSHFHLMDLVHTTIRHITVRVDIFGQQSILKHFNRWDPIHDVPTFPLNTGAILLSGHNATISNCYTEMFDDALCTKSTNSHQNLSKCTTDFIWEDSEIVQGLGATVGSVWPSADVQCVANITYRNIHFKNAIKAIYVKPNPCHPGTGDRGIIHNVTYENITAVNTSTWGIYVGTQQQAQPGGGANTGCSFFYPLPGTKCEPCWQVPVTELKLRNVHMEGALISPGMMRCATGGQNGGGACTGWEWTNVTIKSVTNWPIGNNFLCEEVKNYTFTNVSPSCIFNKTQALIDGGALKP